MKRRFLSTVLAVFMVVNIIGSFRFGLAAGETKEYIISLDMEKFNPDFELEFRAGNISEAKKLSEEFLDIFEGQLKKHLPNLEVLDRFKFLMPGLLVKMNLEDLIKVEGMDYVLKIYENSMIRPNKPENKARPLFMPRSAMGSIQPMGTHSDRMIENDNLKYSGRGSVLSILDVDMNPRHYALVENGGLENKVKGDSSFEGSYASVKVPFAWNYALGNNSVNAYDNIYGHGQHVAGIAAGNKVQIFGKTWKGVAPDAQLLMMDLNGGSENLFPVSKILEAANKSLELGADAINMSFGGDYSFGSKSQKKPIQDALEMASKLGVSVVIAAGNAGDLAGNINIYQPDISTLADPGNVESAITVASNQNLGRYVLSYKIMNADGDTIIYGQGNPISEKGFDEKTSYSLIDCGSGEDFDFGKHSFDDKSLALVSGEISEHIIENSKRYGVHSIIFYEPTILEKKSIEKYDIAVGQIPLERANLGDLKDLKISFEYLDKPYDDARRPNDFSSWGMTSDRKLKPDLMAPGGSILSLNNKNGFYYSDGTSMATPHVTGAVGLLAQRYRQDAVFNKQIFINKKEALRSDIFKMILMNTAEPYRDENGALYSPRKQGAGMLNVKRALNTKVIAYNKADGLAAFSLGDLQNDTLKMNLGIKSLAGNAKYRIDYEVNISETHGKVYTLRPRKLFTGSYDGGRIITVDDKNDSLESIEIKIPEGKIRDLDIFDKGAFVEGFIRLIPQDDKSVELSLPFVGFRSGKDQTGYGGLPVIEKPIYDFDFESEKPIYWGFKGVTDSTWQNYFTNIKTDLNGKDVILGMPNFDEVNESNLAEDKSNLIKPEFDRALVLSPNGDGRHDKFQPNFISLINGSFRASLRYIDDQSSAEEEVWNSKKVYHNIPINGATTPFSYTNINPMNKNGQSINLNDENAYQDGHYELKIYGARFKDYSSDTANLYPEQVQLIPFIIDRTAPEIINLNYDSTSRRLYFEVKDELSDIREVKVGDRIITGKPVKKGKESTDSGLNRKHMAYEYNVEAGQEIEKLEIEAVDLGYNIKASKISEIPRPKVTFRVKDEKNIDEKHRTVQVDYAGNINDAQRNYWEKLEKPAEHEYVWYYDSEYQQKVEKRLSTLIIREDTTLYGRLEKRRYKLNLHYFISNNDQGNIGLNPEMYVSLGDELSLKEIKALACAGVDKKKPFRVKGRYKVTQISFGFYEIDMNNETILITEELIKEGRVGLSLNILAKLRYNCEVTLDYGHDGQKNVVKRVEEGKTLKKPDTPTRPGYEFTGWYTDVKLKNKFDFNSKIFTDLTLYAGWKEVINYTVIFDSDGGSPVKSQTIRAGEQAKEPDAPNKEGHSFEGWYQGEVKYDFTKAVEKDLTLKARWTKNTHTVRLDYAYDNKVEEISIKYGDQLVEPATPTRPGYKFTGWYTDKGLTEKFDFETKIKGNLTLYAGWEKLVEPKPPLVTKHRVILVYGNGQPNLKLEVEDGEEIKRPATPTRPGYEFTGWYKDRGLKEKFDFNKQILTDLTLYAGWEKLADPKPPLVTKHKVILDYGHGLANLEMEVEDGEKIGEVDLPELTGYEFMGWFQNGYKYDLNLPVKSDLILTARWSKLEMPKPNPEPYEPSPEYQPSEPYRPSPEYRPSDDYQPSPEYRQENLAKKDGDKENQEEMPIEESPIQVAEASVKVNLIDLPENELGEAIRNMVNRGVLKGTGQDKFEPETTITRAMVVEVFMRISRDKEINTDLSFRDVKAEAWYRDAVKWAATKGLVKGFEDGSFKPQEKVTRQEFAVMLDRMLRAYKIEMPLEQEVEPSDYSHVLDWSRQAVVRMLERGLVKADKNGNYDPTSEFTRAELAASLNKIIEWIEAEQK